MNEQNIFHLPVKIFDMGGVLFISTSWHQMNKLRNKLGIDSEIKDVTSNWKEPYKNHSVLSMAPIPVARFPNSETIVDAVGGLVEFCEITDGMMFLDKIGDKEMGRGTNA